MFNTNNFLRPNGMIMPYIRQKKKKLWTPSGVTGMALWLDALDAETLALDGSAVTQWDDKSGNSKNATQSTASYQPAYDSTDKSVNFDSDYMSIPDVSCKCGFAVIRNANGNAGNASVTTLIGVSNSSSFIFARTSTADYSVSIDGDGKDSGDISINGGGLIPGDGTGTNISITGYVPFPTHNESDEIYWQINNSRTFQNIGRTNNDASNAKCDFHEILLFSSYPSESDRQKIEGYLAHRWGFASKLPSGHPYKSAAPMED
jgi:hypothetical protein